MNLILEGLNLMLVGMSVVVVFLSLLVLLLGLLRRYADVPEPLVVQTEKNEDELKAVLAAAVHHYKNHKR